MVVLITEVAERDFISSTVFEVYVYWKFTVLLYIVFVADFMGSVICNPVRASMEDSGLVGTMLNQLRTGKDTSDFSFFIPVKQFKSTARMFYL